MEKFLSTKSRDEKTVLHYNVDEEKGVPYCGLHVNENGDFWFTVYGALCFGRSSHYRMINQFKPTGKNITTEKHLENIRKK